MASASFAFFSLHREGEGGREGGRCSEREINKQTERPANVEFDDDIQQTDKNHKPTNPESRERKNQTHHCLNFMPLTFSVGGVNLDLGSPRLTQYMKWLPRGLVSIL